MNAWRRLAAACVLAAPGEQDPFPAAAPASVQVDAAWLDALAAEVQAMAERDAVVGAELLVIRSDRTVLHRAFGWKDRESRTAMALDTVFCVRSMTKPVVGTAAQMLMEDGAFAPEDAVSKYLDSFDVERCRAVRIEHLLHHTSGLPLSSLVAGFDGIGELKDVAVASAASGPQFEPGSRWSYSDDGVDTLGAVIEVVARKPLTAVLSERVLEPLGMHSSITRVTDDSSLRDRIASNYLGAAGAWTRYWKPGDAPLFPLFLASQSLYCSPRDYARLLGLWKDRGRFGGERRLRLSTVERALAPGPAASLPTGFRDVRVHWGELWQLWVESANADGRARLLAFGHGGSDGTWAYAFPTLDLLVLCFTQSRNSHTFVEFESALERKLLDPLRGTSSSAAIEYGEAELAAISGLYWDDERTRPLVVARSSKGLTVEFAGKTRVDAIATPERDVFSFPLAARAGFRVVRDEHGAVLALEGRNGDARELHPLLAPDSSAPSIADVLALRRTSIDERALLALGARRLRGAFEMPTRKLSGTLEVDFDGMQRLRTALHSESLDVALLLDGPNSWLATSGRRTPQDEASTERLAFDHPLAPLADWSELYSRLFVLARVRVGDSEQLLLLAVPRHAHERYLYVDARNGRLLRELRLEPDWGLPAVGSTVVYDDWRAVGDVELPFRVETRYASRLLGTFTASWATLEALERWPDASSHEAEGK